MAVISLTPQEVMEERTRVAFGSYRPPDVRNTGPALWLEGPVRFPAVGRIWEVRRGGSYTVAVEAMKLLSRIQAWGRENQQGEDATEPLPTEAWDRYGALIHQAVDLISRAVIPARGPVRRLAWRLGSWRKRNPFDAISLGEVAGILGFFGTLQMRSDAQPSDASDPDPSTLWESWLSSPTSSPRGAARTVSH